MIPDDIFISNVLATLKLSKEAFAKLIGVSTNTVYKWLKGTRKVSPSSRKYIQVLVYIYGTDTELYKFIKEEL